jgi:hypothetical protein
MGMISMSEYRTKGIMTEEHFTSLLRRTGGLPIYEFLELPTLMKKRVSVLHAFLRAMPDRTTTADCHDILPGSAEELSHMEVLLMLWQGGYLRRDKEEGRVIHVKTDLASALSGEELAADMVNKVNVMCGFQQEDHPVRRTVH